MTQFSQAFNESGNQCGRLFRDSKIIYQSSVVGNPPTYWAQENTIALHKVCSSIVIYLMNHLP